MSAIIPPDTGERRADGAVPITHSPLTLYEELERLAEFICASRREIAAIRPEEICELHIPRATDQLDAVVRMAESATGTILDSAEAIDAICPALLPEHRQPIQAAVTNIYQACNFQDITGQRVTKVMTTLRHIEDRLGTLLGLFGQDSCDKTLRDPSVAATGQGGDEGLLNGPQLPRDAVDQSDIDQLMAKP